MVLKSQGPFLLKTDTNRSEFIWSVTFVSADSHAIVSDLNYLGRMAQAMSEALTTQFALKPE